MTPLPTTTDTKTPYGDTYAPIAAKAADIRDRDWRLVIHNELVPAASGETFVTIDPATEQPLAHVPEGGAADIARAVESAKEGFEVWRRYSVRDRAKAVREVAEVLREHADELALLDTLDGGSPITSMKIDALWSGDFLDQFADWALMLRGETIPASATGVHYTKMEPYGVVGRIIPFNHPVLFAAGKLGAPLMAGNAVVVKPPPQAPLSALRAGELCAQVLPPGVVNVVTGSLPEPGIALASHPDVRRIAFIGSERTGREIQRIGAEAAVKHVTLELGGKNAMVVLPDADLEKAAQGAVTGMNFTASQGESCGSNSRVLLHESIAEEVIGRIADLAEQIRVGVPVDPETQMGALVSAQHYERVMSYVQAGIEEGATLVTGGRRPEHLPTGYFLEPTVFSGVDMSMKIAREEIFGPVMSILTFRDDEEALRMANDVRYGLTASIWTNDITKAFWFVDGFEAGFCWVNDSARHFPGVPFGGYKASGVGREEGLQEILEMMETKSVNVRLDG